MVDQQLNEVAASVTNKLASLPRSSSQPCIFKIPRYIREVNEKAYRPTVVSIGPNHCQEPHLQLQAIQDLKSAHLHWFLQATSDRCSLVDYLRFQRDNEEKARGYYAETVSLSSTDFILMLLIDAVFVINYLMLTHREACTKCPGSNLISRRIEIATQVRRDLLLEDNQLPFFVLQNIYDLAFGTTDNNIQFTDVTCAFVFGYFNIKSEVTCDSIQERVKKELDIKHLVDFVLICLKPSTRRENIGNISFCSSVTNLHAAGVKFEASKSENFLDITFDKGVLRIPKFSVQDSSESIHRSIVLFEQCHRYPDTYFIDYMNFLDSLINTREDVHILVRSGIINTCLGSDDAVADLFNNITKHISLIMPKYYYATISKRLNAHASTRFNRWKAILKRDYFNHPWAIISVIYAVFLLVLTLLQTIRTFTQ